MAVRVPRVVKKVERPRPLKTSNVVSNRYSQVDGPLTAEGLLYELESVALQLENRAYSKGLGNNVERLCANLKLFGTQLESVYKDQLNKAFVALRNACSDEKLEPKTRLFLLEVIELRAHKWHGNENIALYYQKTLARLENGKHLNEIEPESSSSGVSSSPFVFPTQTASQGNISPIASVLAPGEVLRGSGKYAKPTQIPGKNYFKDEIVIRNSDSGKVMGIKGRRVHMIEELSETVISFQRVSPGTKDRLVQITGPHDAAISNAKHLIQETIQRNASPVRCDTYDVPPAHGLSESNTSLNSSNSDEVVPSPVQAVPQRKQTSFAVSENTAPEYKYSIRIGDQLIKILGTNIQLVQTAKLVLDDYFIKDVPVQKACNSSALEPSSCNSVIGADGGAASKTSSVAAVKQPSPVIRYDRDFLLYCSTSPHSLVQPADFNRILKEIPAISREILCPFDYIAYKQQMNESKVLDILPNLFDVDRE